METKYKEEDKITLTFGFPDGTKLLIDAYEEKDENGEVIGTVIPPESQFIKMSSEPLLSNK